MGIYIDLLEQRPRCRRELHTYWATRRTPLMPFMPDLLIFHYFSLIYTADDSCSLPNALLAALSRRTALRRDTKFY